AGDVNFIQQTASWPDQYKINVSNFFNALEEDRKGLFMDSLLRSLFFIGAAVLLLWLVIRNKFQPLWAFIILGVLAFIDVMGINAKYLNAENYQDPLEYQDNFAASPADQQINQDPGYFRVLDLRQGIQSAFNGGALTMYHHLSVGGYHPAKLSIYQDLIEHQLYRFPESLPVFNMLNTKYVMQQAQGGQVQVIPNPDALGNVWFVDAVRYEATPQAVMKAMDRFQPSDTAILFSTDQSKVTSNAGSPIDSIWLKVNDNDDVTYGYSAAAPRFAVFSEVFYDKGWKAYVDGKELPIIRTNYVLRGLTLPAGQNKEIKFEFRPDSFYTGEKIALAAGIILYLLLIAALVQTYRNRTKTDGGRTEIKTPGTTKTRRA
ncbi:MAG: YfhO family protein, partial [Flavisolibacter sp.]